MTPRALDSDRIRLVALAVACALALGTLARTAAAQIPLPEPEGPGFHLEIEDDPPGIPARPVAGGARTLATVSYGRFAHIQVNVEPGGVDIPGDAANEPSIAVDPTGHNRMAIGWRQFDTISSNFREAGYAYTVDGGLTWTKNEIQPGVFRSDPVLGADAGGKLYYSSLTSSGGFAVRYFPSVDGGQSWGAPVFGYGGDKQWFTIGTGTTGNVQLYQAWSTAGNMTAPNTFNRSTNRSASFETPTQIPSSPVWGTLAVGPDGTVYVVGRSSSSGAIYVARSTNAKDPAATPTFTTVTVNLGGTIQTGGPNPDGLLGQLWIAVDHSAGPRLGWVYVLGSVATGTDPMDVHFIRSTDGGQTWSAPKRVNDDPTGNNAWQWFGTMSVSPTGRIDAVWNDSRATGVNALTSLHYAFSTDGGATWSPNEQASPVWDSRIGWPNQNKIGDYYHMVSDATGADLAWSATFTGGQDVYYVRIDEPTTAVERADATAPRLLGAVPNPFQASTSIRFETPMGAGRVRLEVFDAQGRRVAMLVDGPAQPGARTVQWTVADGAGRPLSNGVYLCRLTAGRFETSRKLLLIR